MAERDCPHRGRGWCNMGGSNKLSGDFSIMG